ncbi:MAG: hypothetical protein FJ045_05630 [Crenarchaeota archaeon]|nr:hypothetical protein [Thermoproteota archaeon]
MVENKRVTTESEAQQIAEKFLLTEYFDSKINFNESQLITVDSGQVYHLRGTIIMRSRSMLDRFVGPKSANKYEFKIEIDAQQGQIVNYELK